MILPAQTIRKLCLSDNGSYLVNPMIVPFHERGKAHGVSYGLSPAGYDIRLDQDVWLWPFWGRLGSSI